MTHNISTASLEQFRDFQFIDVKKDSYMVSKKEVNRLFYYLHRILDKSESADVYGALGVLWGIRERQW